MATVNRKDIPEKHNMLGQYFTPTKVVDFCLSHTNINKDDVIIEPSCGNGIFLRKIREKYDNVLIGIEVDEEIDTDFAGSKICINFYDYNISHNKMILIGNPPFHCPATSLTNHPIYNRKEYLRKLSKKYNISGIREEAVFFIIKSVDLILSNNKTGDIYFILPKNIFHNNSRSYQSFHKFLRENVRLESVWDIDSKFDKVNLDLCYVHFVVDGNKSNNFLLNGVEANVGDFYGINEDMIPFQNIFKKTYLGSVPCESVLLSVKNEPLEHFKNRLYKLVNSYIDEGNLLEYLSYNGEVHLVALKNKDPNKIKVVAGYVNEIKRLLSPEEFLKDGCYKPIQHRKEVRYYFRHNALKKANFLYQLNPNPCQSFYFPGNPTKSLDYYGFCTYDVNRNSSSGALRSVPLQGIDNNLTEEFKIYWDENTKLPYVRVFDYLSYILESDWYKMMKKKYQRFYFGVPKVFDKRFYNALLNSLNRRRN